MVRMSDEEEKALERRMDEPNDWRGTCSGCGERLVGTRSELKAHKCGEVLSGSDRITELGADGAGAGNGSDHPTEAGSDSILLDCDGEVERGIPEGRE